MVVPGATLPQRHTQFVPVCDGSSRQFPLHCADEPLNASILPGASGLDALVADSQQPEPKPKPAGDKHGFIVGAYECWSAVGCEQHERVSTNCAYDRV